MMRICGILLGAYSKWAKVVNICESTDISSAQPQLGYKAGIRLEFYQEMVGQK